MSKKFSEARRQSFLRTLEQSGNQTQSAERARVSRSWVTMTRKADGAFDLACRAAIDRFKAGCRQAAQAGARSKPPGGWGFLDGAELVVRGTNGRRCQIARARQKQWTPRVEWRFLEVLAATCNVKAACAAVNMSPPSAYNHRERWSGFAKAWDEALELGYAQLEWGLIDATCNVFSDRDPIVPAIVPPVTAREALQLLHLHKATLGRGDGRAKFPGRKSAKSRQQLDEEATSRLAKLLDRMARSEELGVEEPHPQWAKRRYRSPDE